MSFSADWLALRAEADARARSGGLASRLSAHLAGRVGLRVLDLGSGTGAMLRATEPLLPPGGHWRLVDSDAGLLARVLAPEGARFQPLVADLSAGLEAVFDPAPDLVTCSAFLDLCGAAFVEDLARAAAAAGAAVYAVLSYDGREEWHPPHALDAEVLAAFRADQRRDKGLGPALGPDGAAHLARALEGEGFRVLTAPADWRLLAPADAALIGALAQGTADAVAPALGGRAAEWGASRAGSAIGDRRAHRPAGPAAGVELTDRRVR